MGPGAGPHSAGTRGKFVCLHSPLQFLETPSVHPERMSHSCFPGWSALLSVSLKGHTGSKHPVLPDCPLWGQEPWAGAGGPGAGGRGLGAGPPWMHGTPGPSGCRPQATSFQARWPQEVGSEAGGQTIVACCLGTGGRELFKWPFP